MLLATPTPARHSARICASVSRRFDIKVACEEAQKQVALKWQDPKCALAQPAHNSRLWRCGLHLHFRVHSCELHKHPCGHARSHVHSRAGPSCGAKLKWPQLDFLACFAFSFFIEKKLKKSTKNTQVFGPKNREQLLALPSVFLHSVLSLFFSSAGSTRLFARLPIIFFPFFLAFPSLYPSRPAFSWPTPDLFIAWLENSLAFSAFRLLRSSPDSKHMNHFLFTIRQATE